MLFISEDKERLKSRREFNFKTEIDSNTALLKTTVISNYILSFLQKIIKKNSGAG